MWGEFFHPIGEVYYSIFPHWGVSTGSQEAQIIRLALLCHGCRVDFLGFEEVLAMWKGYKCRASLASIQALYFIRQSSFPTLSFLFLLSLPL